MRRNSGAKPASHLFNSPNCNFFPVGHLDFVFNPLQPCSKFSHVRIEPLSTVTRRMQLRDTLVQNTVKCGKIQNSFYILVLLKLQLHGITAVIRFHTDSKCSKTSASTTERSVANNNNAAGDPSVKDVTATVHGASEVLTTESEVDVLNDSLVWPTEKNEVENTGYAASDVDHAEFDANKTSEVHNMEIKTNTLV